MKVKVELGHFAEEDSRDKLLNDSKKCHDDFKESLNLSMSCLIVTLITSITFMISSFFNKDSNTLIIGLILVIITVSFTLLFLIGGVIDLTKSKYYSIMAYLKKFDEKDQEEVK